MQRRTTPLAILFLFATGLSATAQYGDISGLKLNKPEDRVDAKPVPPPAGAIVLFDGSSLDKWQPRRGSGKTKWKLVKLSDNGIKQARTAMQVVRSGDLITKQKFDGKFKLHVEFRVPYSPKAKGQGRGNSGVYVQGRYEVQVLDSYGLKSKNNDCGGIYEVAAPLVNACKAPTVWQTYDILFEAPKCENGKKVTNAIMTVYHNGIKIHDKVEIKRNFTRAGMNTDPCEPGPILLQDHGNPVQYRNIWLLPMKN